MTDEEPIVDDLFWAFMDFGNGWVSKHLTNLVKDHATAVKAVTELKGRLESECRGLDPSDQGVASVTREIAAYHSVEVVYDQKWWVVVDNGVTKISVASPEEYKTELSPALTAELVDVAADLLSFPKSARKR
jgi:hypothetical protein